MTVSTPLPERFWAKVNRNGPEQTDGSRCWIWTGALRKGIRGNGGYGLIKVDGVSTGAHIVSWFLFFGEWPTQCVLHTCDTRKCVNPGHLFEGTRTQNSADRDAKGRTARGEKIATKLNEERVRCIRELAASGVKHRLIADEHGISESYVGAVISRRKWAHV